MECNEQNQLRCEVGDLSKKHGLYTIHPLSDTEGRRLTSDAYLPLRGPNSGHYNPFKTHHLFYYPAVWDLLYSCLQINRLTCSQQRICWYYMRKPVSRRIQTVLSALYQTPND